MYRLLMLNWGVLRIYVLWYIFFPPSRSFSIVSFLHMSKGKKILIPLYFPSTFVFLFLASCFLSSLWFHIVETYCRSSPPPTHKHTNIYVFSLNSNCNSIVLMEHKISLPSPQEPTTCSPFEPYEFTYHPQYSL